MYIKIGSKRYKYQSEGISQDSLVFAEVLNTGLSSEIPRIVRTAEELDIWFGKDYGDYQQLKKIISAGGQLLLSGPKPNSMIGRIAANPPLGNQMIMMYFEDETITPYPSVEAIYEIKDIFPADNAVCFVDDFECVYQWKNTSGKENALFSDGELIPYRRTLVDLLEEGYSEFKNNRDTLLISSSSGSGKVFSCFPGYFCGDQNTKQQFVVRSSFIDEIEEDIAEPESGKTYSIRFSLSDDVKPEEVLFKDDYFFSYYRPGNDGTRVVIYNQDVADSDKSVINQLSRSGAEMISGVSNLRQLLNTLQDDFSVYPNLSETETSSEWVIYSTRPFKFDDVLDVEATGENVVDIDIFKDEYTNSDIIYKYSESLSDTSPKLMFWSKTIGRDTNIYDDTRDITISIEELDTGDIRVDISRFGWTETFVGSFDARQNEERLDYLISKESKLVYCEYIESSTTGFNLFGKYTMLGAYSIESDTTAFCLSLSELLGIGEDESRLPDFVLIQNPSLYSLDGEIYEYFLSFAKEIGTQFLISEIGLSDLSLREGFNFPPDPENRLVYFYGDMRIEGVSVSAYYPFVIGLLNNSYSYSSGDFNYFIELPEDIEDKISPYEENTASDYLDQYKCNYLVSNNQIYYYKRYNPGESCETTVWTRFIIGKVARELEKNKWDYLGTRISSRIRDKIEGILRKISGNFSIVKNIQISQFSMDPYENTIDLTIDISFTDLIENNVTLDILINYDKQYGN